MVTATQDPYTLRVSFFTQESDTARADIVCNVRAVEDGIDVEYLYHERQTRPMSGSTWQPPYETQLELTPGLISEIESGVMYELWKAFRRKIRVMELPSDGSLLSARV